MNINTSRRLFSRRQFGVTAGAGIAAALVPFEPLSGGSKKGIVPTMIEAAATAKIEIHPVRRNISILEGSGGNIAVLTGRDGKLLVDAGFAVSRAGVTAALASLSSEPITQLVNTHWHTDHTDGNAWVHAAGAAITAHTNTKKHLSTSTRVEGWQWTFAPAPAGALPTSVFNDEHTIRRNDATITLKYYGPAHTDSDISVMFEEADVLHAGDTWWNGIYPFIDYSTGGSIDGTIRAAERNLSAAGKDTIVIPGHGPAGNQGDLREFRDMLVDIRGSVARLKGQGKSLGDVIAERPTAAFDAKFGQFLITPAVFTALVYAGV